MSQERPQANRFFRRHVALPGEHGAWAFLLVPLIVGLAAGGRPHLVSLYLVVASLSVFLARQPLTLAVKALSGRRSKDVLPAAAFWTAVYGGIAALHVTGLVLRGFGYVLWLALPGIPVFAWYLWLIGRREERRQRMVEILAAGAMALAAPAAYWIGVGRPAPEGWMLWLLTWAQSGASIEHAYMRLTQRESGRTGAADWFTGPARVAVSATTVNLAGSIALAAWGATPRFVPLAFALQWAETLWGATHPAAGLKPRAIGYRQLLVTTLFTLVFILAWRAG